MNSNRLTTAIGNFLSPSDEGKSALEYRKRTNRILFVDIARGLCIIGVVWFHNDLGPSRLFNLFIIPTFFILSGIFFSPDISPRAMLKKKFNSLVVPLLVFIVLGLIAEALFFQFHGFRLLHDGEMLYRYPLGTLGNVPLWFVVTLIYITATVYGVEHLVRSAWQKAAIYIALALIGWALAYKRFFLPFYFSQSLVGLPYFLIGYYLSERIKRGQFFSGWLLLAAIVIACWAFQSGVYNNFHQLKIHPWYFPSFMAAMSLGYITLWLAKVMSQFSSFSWLCWLGTSSLYVMGIHDLLQSPVVERLYDDGYFVRGEVTLYSSVLGIAFACFFASVSAWLGGYLDRCVKHLRVR